MYIGMQYGRQCFAGNALMETNKIEDDLCNMKCAHDDSLNCGGSFKDSVYTVPDSLRKGQPKLIGCYIDDPKRDMKFSMGSDIDPATCFQRAAKNGNKYAGL